MIAGSPAAADPPDHAAVRQQALQALLTAVVAKPWDHDFFALMRRIDALRPHAPRTGQTQRPGQEAIRFAQPPELDFAPAALSRLELRDDLPPRLSVRFFGLLGPQGPMPLHLSEYVRERALQRGDWAPAHFFDIFHHRMLSLFYRAWGQAQPAVHQDRPHDDRFRVWLAAMAGLPQGQGAVSDEALAFHAGLLSGRSRHPEALTKVLRHHFGVPAALQCHVGHWMAIEPDDRSSLGPARAPARSGRSIPAQLGHSAVAGSRIWERQYRFRLHLGPLSLAQYNAFLPGGAAWPALTTWVTLLSDPSLRWDLALTLAPEARPDPQLCQRPRLGISAWLGRRGAAPPPAVTVRNLHLRPGTSFLQRRTGA